MNPISSSLVPTLALASLSLFAVTPLIAQDAATLEAGAVAPDFVSNDLDGHAVRLADYHGKVVVLDFWATWCGPCKASLPHAQEIAKAEKDHGVVVLAVCTSDSKEKFEAWVRANGAQYPDIVFTCDPNDRSSDTFEDRASNKLYHVVGLPTKFVIGKDGKIALTMVGLEDADTRLEAGLARVGLPIDAATAKAGEALIAKLAKEDAARAAEAAANPPPPFWPGFGSINAGQPMPDFALVGADGKEFTLSSLRGKPCVLAFAWADVVPRKQLQVLADRYAPYGVQVIAAIVSTSRDEYTQWLQKNQATGTLHLGLDPAGKFAGESANYEARAEFEKGTVLGKYFLGNMRPAMPALVACDGEGRLLGGFPMNRSQDALGNLLLHAGIKLKPEDMPKVTVGEDAFHAPEPRAPEAAVKLLEIGTMAPDFTMQDVDGKDIKLSDYRGKVVVLDFWATWCGPCVASMPHTDEVADRYQDQGVVVVASCTSDARKAFVGWVKQHQQDYPHMLFAHDALEKSPERPSHKLYGVSGIPHQFIIDRDGKIVAMVGGYMKGEVLLEGALAKAGIKVDPAIVEQAAADQKKRDERSKATVPALKLK